LSNIQRWICFALCSKEATVGLQSLLSLVSDMFNYCINSEYQVQDSEALILVPFLLEKASNAKGRFRETFHALVAMIQDETILPSRCLGPIVCVALMERSAHSKARALACQIGRSCVVKLGLSGIGKKGVIAAAKLVSEESIPENRIAALDLMESIFDRMSGDLAKLSRICGPSLSERGRLLLDERCAKRVVVANSKVETDGSQRDTNVKQNRTEDVVFYELPAFSLQSTGVTNRAVRQDLGKNQLKDELGVFAFDFSNESSGERPNVRPESHTMPEGEIRSSSSLGAAASLRARLMKVKEKSREPSEVAVSLSHLNNGRPQPFDFDSGLVSIKTLLLKVAPLAEDDSDLIASIEAVKTFHAALTKQGNVSSALNSDYLSSLRNDIVGKINVLLDCLTKLIEFAFDCGPDTSNAGLSVPLLSVVLAALMALFRDSALLKNISQASIVVLLRETGTALLDPRLTATSKLDQGTSSQMVRAINKVCQCH
jgi:hypothetical protein